MATAVLTRTPGISPETLGFGSVGEPTYAPDDLARITQLEAEFGREVLDFLEHDFSASSASSPDNGDNLLIEGRTAPVEEAQTPAKWFAKLRSINKSDDETAIDVKKFENLKRKFWKLLGGLGISASSLLTMSAMLDSEAFADGPCPDPLIFTGYYFPDGSPGCEIVDIPPPDTQPEPPPDTQPEPPSTTQPKQPITTQPKPSTNTTSTVLEQTATSEVVIRQWDIDESNTHFQVIGGGGIGGGLLVFTMSE